MSSVKEHLLIFASGTSCHGLKTAIGGQNSARIFWSIVFLISFGMFCAQLSDVIRRYINKETSISVQLGYEKLPFPAVTVCNLNPYRVSEMKQIPELAALLSVFSSTSSATSSRRKRDAFGFVWDNITQFDSNGTLGDKNKSKSPTESQLNITSKKFDTSSTSKPSWSTLVQLITKSNITKWKNTTFLPVAQEAKRRSNFWSNSKFGLNGIRRRIRRDTTSTDSTEVTNTNCCSGKQQRVRVKRANPCNVLSLSNGAISYSNSATSTVIYLTTATISCYNGYTLQGSSSRLCDLNGVWSGSTSSCCAPPTTCSTFSYSYGSATYSHSSRPSGSTATINCNTYYTARYSSRTCSCGCTSCTWSNTAQCYRPCGTLSLPSNMNSISYSHTGRVHGSTATFYCNSGYSISGTNPRTCSDASWSGSTSCTANPCSSISVPANAAISYSSSYNHGSTATFSCVVGYSIVGSATRTCSLGAWSSSSPSCASSSCASLATPANGNAPTYSNGQYDGSVATFSCQSGYSVTGTSQLTCSMTNWDNSVPTCTPSPCSSAAAITGGNSPTYSDANKVHGSTATYTCQTGYTLSGTATLTCSFGNWDISPPTCAGNACSGVASPANSNTNTYSSSYNHGSVVTFNCKTGYPLIGEATRTCSAGVWTGSSPICGANACSNLAVPSNGEPISYGDAFNDKSIATYSCSTGYMISGSSTITCDMGSWVGTPPTCTPSLCTSASIVSNADGPNYSDPVGLAVGSTASYTCDTGYTMSGSATLTCTLGLWDGVVPTCTGNPCTALTTPTFGNTPSYSNGQLHGSIATITCQSGYDVIGVGTITCSLGSWDNVEPTCGPSPCTALSVISDGTGPTYTDAARPSGSSASFSCNTGYTLTGSGTLNCLTGSWSATEPTCPADPCDPVLTPSNADPPSYSSTTRVSGSTVSFTCLPLFSMVGTPMLNCFAGSWNDLEPICDAICGPLVLNVEGLTFTYSDPVRRIGSSITFNCNGSNPTSTYIASPSTTVCTQDQIWRTPLPDVCIELSAAAQESVEAIGASIVEAGNNSVALQQTIVDSFAYFASAIDPSVLKRVGQQQSGLIRECHILNQECAHDDITYRSDPGLNNCYSFHDRKDVKYTTIRGGAAEGLQMILNIDQAEYVGTTDRAGVQIIVHDQDETISAETMGKILSPGFKLDIAVKKKKITRLPQPYGDCTEDGSGKTFYYKTKYSVDGCFQSCYQKLLIDKCSCGDPRLPLPDGKAYCSTDKRSCVNEFTSDDSNVQKLTTQCDCPQRCSKNYNKVQIYYAALNYEVLKESSSYGFVNLLSDFGSQMGLWMGVSVLTCFEFGILIVDIIKHLIKKKKQ